MSLRAIGFSLAAMSLFCLSCASLPPATELTFFVPAPEDDPWAQKIGNWQARHELDPIRQGAPPRKSSELAQEYDQFSREMRRQIAAETAAWVQARSRSYYQPDGDRDHWATFGEVVETGRDDCDGLDMLTFQLLRRMGFGAEEIFRAIVVERPTGQHHMVTLWFEDGDRTDPFVLDPTGVVTTEMVRLSEIGSWEPIEIFDETAHYRVEPAPGPASVAGK